MLLPLRAAILNVIAVPAACLISAIASSPVAALPNSETHSWRQGSGRAEPAIPRRVLLIDLNPILEFGAPTLDFPGLNAPGADSSVSAFTVEHSATEQRSSSFSAPGHSDLHRNTAEARVPMSERLAPSGTLLPSAPRQSTAIGNVPPLRSTAPLSAPRTAPPGSQTWSSAPFPSLGQPQLDRQLRRYLTYFETIGRPDIVIVGGQGAAQGVDPIALQAALGDRGYNNLKVFNWGLSHSSAQTVEWLLTELLTPEQLPKLVIWAEASPALNGDRPDSAFARIQGSPGQRLLARGLRPRLAAVERSFAQQLSQIFSNPIQPALPDAVVALARSLQGSPRSAAVNQSLGNQALGNQPLGQSEGTKRNRKAQDKTAKSLDLETASTVKATIAQAAPILIDDRSRVLPILRPQAPVPVLPAASPANGVVNSSLRNQDRDRNLEQPSTGGFRLVNWCRQASGPCPTGINDGSSAANQSTAPAWLRQTQAAQEKLERVSSPQSNASRPASSSAASSVPSLTARRSQTSVTAPVLAPLRLPAWSQSQATERFLQAIGFQSIDQRLAPGSVSPLNARNLTRTFSLQGHQNRALHRLAQFSQRQNMAIAVVPLPLSQRYLNSDRYRHAASFRTYLNVAAQMTPLSLIELPGTTVVWQDALFAQPDRLNRYGAAVLGWQIGQSMDRQLLDKLR